MVLLMPGLSPFGRCCQVQGDQGTGGPASLPYRFAAAEQPFSGASAKPRATYPGRLHALALPEFGYPASSATDLRAPPSGRSSRRPTSASVPEGLV